MFSYRSRPALAPWLDPVTPVAAMPSSRWLSLEEQAKILELRATECKQKAQRKFVNDILEKHPHVLSEIVAKIQALGFSESSIDQSPCAKSLQRAAANKRKGCKANLAMTDGVDIALIVTPYRRLDACSTAFLIENVLAHCEPAAMSEANFKRFLAGGMAMRNRELLLEIVEFSTGLPQDTPLSGKLATLVAFKQLCLERHLARGRRTRDLPLPPTWQKHGIYEIQKIADEFIEIKHRFLERTVRLSASDAPAVADECDYTLLFNFSELRCALADSKDHDQFVLLYPLFQHSGPMFIATTPPTKRTRVAIGVGPSEEPGSACSLNDLTTHPTVTDVGGLDPASETSASAVEDDIFGELAGIVERGAAAARVLDFDEAELQVPAPADEA